MGMLYLAFSFFLSVFALAMWRSLAMCNSCRATTTDDEEEEREDEDAESVNVAEWARDQYWEVFSLLEPLLTTNSHGMTYSGIPGGVLSTYDPITLISAYAEMREFYLATHPGEILPDLETKLYQICAQRSLTAAGT